jgi:hypothetical protein
VVVAEWNERAPACFCVRAKFGCAFLSWSRMVPRRGRLGDLARFILFPSSVLLFSLQIGPILPSILNHAPASHLILYSVLKSDCKKSVTNIFSFEET